MNARLAELLANDFVFNLVNRVGLPARDVFLPLEESPVRRFKYRFDRVLVEHAPQYESVLAVYPIRKRVRLGRELPRMRVGACGRERGQITVQLRLALGESRVIHAPVRGD